MSFEQDRKLNVAILLSKTKTLQFEISAKDSVCFVEDGIGECTLEAGKLKVEINQKDLGNVVSRLKSLEILNTHGCSCLSKLFYLTDGKIFIEMEMSEDLRQYQDEICVEVRLVYKIK